MNMNRISKLIATLSASMVISGAAFALDGFSIGVIGTTADFNTSGKELKGEHGGAKETDASTSITKSVDYPSAFIDYTHVWNQFGLTVGLEVTPGDASLGAKSRTDAESPADTDSDDGTFTAKAEVSDYQVLYIEPTIMLKENVGFYLKGGVSEVTVNSLESGTTMNSVYGNETVYGLMRGVGIKATHENGIGFKLEHVITDYEGIELVSTTGNKNRIEADIDQTATRLAIFYNF